MIEKKNPIAIMYSKLQYIIWVISENSITAHKNIRFFNCYYVRINNRKKLIKYRVNN